MSKKQILILAGTAAITVGLIVVGEYGTAVYFVAAFLCGNAAARRGAR